MKNNLLLTNQNIITKVQYLIMLIMLFSCVNIAQEVTYISKGSIGDNKTNNSEYELQFSVGDRVIFPPEKRKPEYYSSIMIEKDASRGQSNIQNINGRIRVADNFETISPFGLSNSKNLNYEQYVGRIGKIIGLGEKKSGIYLPLQIQMEDNNEKITVVLTSSYSLVPVAPIDKLRTQLKGKTIWLRDNSLSIYDQNRDSFGTLDLPKQYLPLKVVDVVVGWETVSPLRLILETKSGEKGYLDFSVGDFEEKFNYKFFTKDPRTVYKWSASAWASIEDGQVWVGMTKAQAELAWGEPNSINRTTTRRGVLEQWVYGSGNYLYFANGTLTSFQN
jgi:hypothetical protein